MNVYFSVLSLVLSLIIFIAIIFIAYLIIKKAVKNGILEAYKEIHNKQ